MACLLDYACWLKEEGNTASPRSDTGGREAANNLWVLLTLKMAV